MIKFRESGHPVFRATSPLSRGTLKSKGGGKLSVHFCADGDTIETVFRTIISVNQLSIYGAVSDFLWIIQYSCQTRTVRPVLAGHSDPLFDPAKFLIMTPRPSVEIPAQENLLQKYKNEWKGSHNKIVWLKFVLMQDSWQQLTSDSTSWQKTLTSSYNLQNQWHVLSSLCHEMKTHLNQKVGFEGTPKLDPCWKSQPVSYLQGKCGVEIRIESVNKDTSHSWVRISHGLNKLVTDLIDKEYDDNEQETSETKTEMFEFASRSKAKAKRRGPSTTCSSSRTLLIFKDCSYSWKNMDWYWIRSSTRSSLPSGKKNEHSASTRRTSRRR